MADVHSKLDELCDLIDSAKAVPLSASCVVNRADLLAALDELRQMLPQEIAAATGVLRERNDVLDEGHAEADRIIERAQTERAELVSRTAVTREAEANADRIVSAAEEQARTMRVEVEDYVDGKLANFEVVLHKTIAAVERGRDKLRGQREGADLTSEELDGDDD